MATVTVGAGFQANMDGVNFSSLAAAVAQGRVLTATSSLFVLDYGGGNQDRFSGSFFYDAQGVPYAGFISQYEGRLGGATALTISGLILPVAAFVNAILSGDAGAQLRLMFSEADSFVGGVGTDVFRGYEGNDTLRGAGGADTLDGGAGTDTAVYSGSVTDYEITHLANGSFRVVDLRAGSPDGTDSVVNVELGQFSEGVLPFLSTTGHFLRFFHLLVLRADPLTGPNGAVFLSSVNAGEFGGQTLTQALAELIQLADSTTSVATLAYQFFTGRTPSQAGLNYLVDPGGVNPNNLNSAYYQSFNLENRFINFAVNLGKLGEGVAQFSAAYGSKSLIDSAKTAYTTIFGAAPTDAKVHALIDSRIGYFAAYGGDGPEGIGTKAAMVGWLLGEAVKADIGSLQTANMAYLSDLGHGVVTYGVDLIGVYHGTPYLGG